MRCVVTSALGLFCLLFLSGCVINGGQQIRSENTTWIQKGQTTREEIVSRFGQPSLTGTREGVGEYVEYQIPGHSTVALEPTPSGPFPQAYRPPAQTMPEAESLSERLWVLYDRQGVVKD